RPAASEPAVHQEKISSWSSNSTSGEASCAAMEMPGMNGTAAKTALPAASCRRLILRVRKDCIVELLFLTDRSDRRQAHAEQHSGSRVPSCPVARRRETGQSRLCGLS